MNKYEQLIEHIISDEESKARALFHQIVVSLTSYFINQVVSLTSHFVNQLFQQSVISSTNHFNYESFL
jgi:hypothetical protein